MFTDRLETKSARWEDNSDVKDMGITRKEMLAMTIAAYQVLFPFLAIMFISYGGLMLLFNLIIK